MNDPSDVPVLLSDTDQLDDPLKHLLDRLINASDEELDRYMNWYVHHPGEGRQDVVRHPDLVERTVKSLDRLVNKAQRALQMTTEELRRSRNKERIKAQIKERREAIQGQINLYAAERKILRPYLNLALAEAARESSRARAERLLGRLLYAKYVKDLIADFDAGLSEREVEARFHQRHPGATR